MSTDETESARGKLRHDIKNQLSNITLALEQLKYEVSEQSTDAEYYFETIFSSCKKITQMLNDL